MEIPYFIRQSSLVFLRVEPKPVITARRAFGYRAGAFIPDVTEALYIGLIHMADATAGFLPYLVSLVQGKHLPQLPANPPGKTIACSVDSWPGLLFPVAYAIFILLRLELANNIIIF